MELNIHLYHHHSDSALAVLVRTLSQEIHAMSEQLDRLASEVSENATVIDSAIVLINGLAQQIRDLANDPAALTALADSLDAKSNQLADAVAASSVAP